MTCAPYLTRTSSPAVEPVTLSEVKTFLKVEHSDDDGLLSNLISAARVDAENFLSRSLITQGWRMSFDSYIPYELLLAMTPVQSISSVKAIDKQGTEATISAATYHLGADNRKVIFDIAVCSYKIEIDYVAGYGDAAADVPSPIRQGILNHIAYMYEHRGLKRDMPLGASRYYWAYRIVRL